MKNLDASPKTEVTTEVNEPLISPTVLDTVVENITPGTAKSANVDWFVVDVTYSDEIQPGTRAAICRCDLIFEDNDAVISFTFDGVTFSALNEGFPLAAGSLYSIPFGGENGNAFNIQSSKAVTIRKCVVSVEEKEESIP